MCSPFDPFSANSVVQAKRNPSLSYFCSIGLDVGRVLLEDARKHNDVDELITFYPKYRNNKEWLDLLTEVVPLTTKDEWVRLSERTTDRNWVKSIAPKEFHVDIDIEEFVTDLDVTLMTEEDRWRLFDKCLTSRCQVSKHYIKQLLTHWKSEGKDLKLICHRITSAWKYELIQREIECDRSG